MNQIETKLKEMEERANRATGNYGIHADCWESARDALKLVQALRRALDWVEDEYKEDAKVDIAAILDK